MSLRQAVAHLEAENADLRAQLEAKEAELLEAQQTIGNLARSYDASERGAAAMRASLEWVVNPARAALASDAGKDFVPRAELDEALRALDSVASLGIECFTDGSTTAPCPGCECNTCETLREVEAVRALRKPDGGE